MKLVRSAPLVLAFAALSFAAPVKKKIPARKPTAAQLAAQAKARAAQAQARARAVETVHRIEESEPAQIENAAALIPFFERLYRAEREGGEPVRIVHYGDSHTASDEWTGRLRALFQSRFGDGGAGFSLAGYPFRGHRRYGLRGSMTRGWTVHGLLDRAGDSIYGLGNAAISTARRGEIASLDLTGTAGVQRVELFFYRQPGGGWVQVLEEGRPVEAFSTDGPAGPGYFAFETTAPHLEVETLDDDPVRLFGWALDNARGVTYESLGVNGAQISLLDFGHDGLWSEQLARRDPALVVLAYGTNEASNPNWTESSYYEALAARIARIRAAAPAASVLIVGPPDRQYRVRGRGWRTFPRMNEIVAAQRRAARDFRCAFWDLRERMGGEGAIARWVLAGYAQRDYVHFTAPGYQLIGEVAYRDILTEYDRFRRVRERVFEGSSHGSTGDHR